MKKFLGDYLSVEDKAELKATLKSEQWEDLKKECIESWKNHCSESIVKSPNKEALDFAALELKHGTRAMIWFFMAFLPSVVGKEEKKIIDKEQD